MTFPENGKTFNIDAMNPSWTSTADSNIYTRGQSVNLQVSAKTMPERQQLFIQSCFVSASPEPHTRPKQPVIMNKGCTAPLGSPHAVVQFVASAVHPLQCLDLRPGVNFGSKSCNYNLIQSRWEDLSGNVEVCKCCTSKCKGLQIKNLPEGAKAMVSTGPFVIVEKPIEPRLSESQETSSAPVAEAMQSDRAVTEATIVSGTSVSRLPQAVVVVSQDPVARLTFWLPGQVRDTGHSEKINSEDILTFKLQASDIWSNEIQPSSTDQEPLLNMPTNMVIDQSANELGSDFNYLTLVDGLAIPKEKRRFGRSGIFDTEALQDADILLTADMNVNVLNQNDCNKMREGLAVTPQEESDDAQPIVRSKLQFSKGTDGSQTLSYEEDVMRQQSKGVIGRFWNDGIQRKQEPRRRGLHSTFLDLLRRMDKAE
ncbi:uncharacterized protein LOC129103778 [Anoplopoma fimbria]|uniref:uncharacterized protein LOC129103778 n=1 Tax=Anoplopoma fimbria TaxID=229290 RepID=UPI0023ED42A3|nr:uncharacterized protein LOC129103778 [Anoplopoma fimbria]